MFPVMICFDAIVQALPAKNEVIVELQPYIENVLRADDPKFWEKLRFEIILSLDKKFLTNDLKLKLISQKGPWKIIFFSRLDLPEKEPDKVEEKEPDMVDTPVASSSQGGGVPLYPALDEEMLEQL